jgi:hypothetical protein
MAPPSMLGKLDAQHDQFVLRQIDQFLRAKASGISPPKPFQTFQGL